MAETENKKHWSWRARLFNLPPIDWEALAAKTRRGGFGKGDKHTRAAVAKSVAGRKRTMARKAKEKRRRYKVPGKHLAFSYRCRDRHPLTARQRLLVAIEPGEWTTRPEMREASGMKRGSVELKLRELERAGCVEREEDSTWRPHEYVKGVPVEIQAQRPCRYRYRLTATGEAERALALALV